MKTLASILSLVCYTTLFSQSALDLQPGPAEGQDARIFNLDALANYGSDVDLIASQLDYGGEPGATRSVIKFNLSSIPEGSSVVDARLSLWYNHESGTPGQLGDNAAVLRRLVVPWDESTVVWAQQPVYSLENEVFLPASGNSTQDYLDINVTELVNDMVEFSGTSHGFMFMLQDEQFTGKSMKFYSSDAAIPEKRPRLVVSFSPLATNDQHVIPINVFPNPFQNYLSIDGLSGVFDVTITDQQGREMHREKIEALNDYLFIDSLEDFPVGLYFVRISTDERIYVSKAFKF